MIVAGKKPLVDPLLSRTAQKQNEDDIEFSGGWISLSDFNTMKKEQNSRFNAAMRRMKIQRLGDLFGKSVDLRKNNLLK